MMNLKNWKTTIVGFITGSGISITAIVEQGISKGWPTALLGVGVILLGALAKDAEKSSPLASEIIKAGLPIAADLTATSANPTIADVHKVLLQIQSQLNPKPTQPAA